MVLRLCFALLFLFAGCTTLERDNAYDQKGSNYGGQQSDSEKSSSSAEQSSSSVVQISSSSSASPPVSYGTL